MEEFTKADFAEYVFNMRNSAKLSINEFAKRIGKSPLTVTNYEKERSSPTNDSRYELIERIQAVVKEEIRRKRAMKKWESKYLSISS